MSDQTRKDMVTLVGVKADGTEHVLGQATMPPKMRARELVIENFGGIDGVSGNDAAMAFWVCEQLIEWMGKQGGLKVELTQPTAQEAQQAVPVTQEMARAFSEALEPGGWDRADEKQRQEVIENLTPAISATLAAAPKAEPKWMVGCLTEMQVERAWRLGFRHACEAERLNSDEEWGYKGANVIEEVSGMAPSKAAALDRPKGLPVAEVCEDVGRKWARMLTDLPPGTMLYAAAQARSPAQRENTQINELLAQYEEECCDFTNLQWVVEASRRNVTTMPDSQVRCLLHTLAEHVAFKAPAVQAGKERAE